MIHDTTAVFRCCGSEDRHFEGIAVATLRRVATPRSRQGSEAATSRAPPPSMTQVLLVTAGPWTRSLLLWTFCPAQLCQGQIPSVFLFLFLRSVHTLLIAY